MSRNVQDHQNLRNNMLKIFVIQGNGEMYVAYCQHLDKEEQDEEW